MDVLRKETLIILLVASVLLLADPWQRANPEVTTTCGEVSKHPHVRMTKGIFKICLGLWLQFSKTDAERGRGREDKADVLIYKLSSADKQEMVLSSVNLHEVGAGWCTEGYWVKIAKCPHVEMWNELANKHNGAEWIPT